MKHSHLVILGLAIGLILPSCKSRRGVSADTNVEPCQYVAVEDYHPAVPAEYVDLGLPSGTLWAPFNLGATKPSEVGDKFAWGEVTPKSRYDWGTYKYAVPYEEEFEFGRVDKGYNVTKYKFWHKTSDDQIDSKSLIEESDDAASNAWGPSWRLPSGWECRELCMFCQRKEGKLDGVRGVFFTGPNGNTLFLPTEYEADHHVKAGIYWTSDLNRYRYQSYADECAHTLGLSQNGEYHIREILRYQGLYVRPVKAKPDLNRNVFFAQKGGEFIVKSSIFSSGNVSIDGVVDSFANGEFRKKLQYGAHTAFFTTNMGGNTYSTDTIDFYLSPSPKTTEALDLGLSVKWAPFNIGATDAAGSGDFYAFGDAVPLLQNPGEADTVLDVTQLYEVAYNSYYPIDSDDDEWYYGDEWDYGYDEDSDSYYDEDAYIVDVYVSRKKYYDITEYPVDLQAKDAWIGRRRMNCPSDPASLGWGGGWRMPSQSEWWELYRKCDWKWGMRNGVPGYFIQSKDEKYTDVLFLPVSRLKSDDSHDAPLSGAYWSATQYDGRPYRAYCMVFDNCDVNTYGKLKMNVGLMIRPVLPKNEKHS